MSMFSLIIFDVLMNNHGFMGLHGDCEHGMMGHEHMMCDLIAYDLFRSMVCVCVKT